MKAVREGRRVLLGTKDIFAGGLFDIRAPSSLRRTSTEEHNPSSMTTAAPSLVFPVTGFHLARRLPRRSSDLQAADPRPARSAHQFVFGGAAGDIQYPETMVLRQEGAGGRVPCTNRQTPQYHRVDCESLFVHRLLTKKRPWGNFLNVHDHFLDSTGRQSQSITGPPSFGARKIRSAAAVRLQQQEAADRDEAAPAFSGQRRGIIVLSTPSRR